MDLLERYAARVVPNDQREADLFDQADLILGAWGLSPEYAKSRIIELFCVTQADFTTPHPWELVCVKRALGGEMKHWCKN